MVAALAGDAEMTSALLAKGANINHADTKGVTALIAAASKGNTEVVQRLLDGGADKTKKVLDGSSISKQKMTPSLHFVLHTSHPTPPTKIWGSVAHIPAYPPAPPMPPPSTPTPSKTSSALVPCLLFSLV